MIRDIEIKELARSFGVPPTTIERDYAQNWLLASLHSIEMVLKGGTGIRKVYIENYRFSDDLDFTLLRAYESPSLISAIQDAIISARDASGIAFLEEVRLIPTDSGYRGNTYFQSGLMQAGNRIGIHLDITDPSNERVLRPVQELKIIHNYSDRMDSVCRVYSLDEIFAEKLRSIFQRTRPRDLYDIYHLIPHITLDDFGDLFHLKCRTKGVKPAIRQILEKREAFAAGWSASLSHQIRPLPDFDVVFEGVIGILKDFGVNDDEEEEEEEVDDEKDNNDADPSND